MIDFIVRGDSAVMRMAREGHVARTSSGRLERAHGFLLGAQCPDVDGLEHIVGPKVIHFAVASKCRPVADAQGTAFAVVSVRPGRTVDNLNTALPSPRRGLPDSFNVKANAAARLVFAGTLKIAEEQPTS